MGEELAVPTNALLAQSALAASTLKYWVKQGVVSATVVPPEGQRYPVYWSIPEAVAVRVIKQLRDGGCPMDVVHHVQGKVNEALTWTEPALLYWTGTPPLRIARPADVKKIPKPGKHATHAVFAPVTRWRDDAISIATPVDPDKVRNERAARRNGRPRRAPVENHPDD